MFVHIIANALKILQNQCGCVSAKNVFFVFGAISFDVSLLSCAV